jgi:hypothetical protein
MPGCSDFLCSSYLSTAARASSEQRAGKMSSKWPGRLGWSGWNRGLIPLENAVTFDDEPRNSYLDYDIGKPYLIERANLPKPKPNVDRPRIRQKHRQPR